MYQILLGTHSWFRYLVFILLAAALLIAMAGWLGKTAYRERNRKLNLFAMISAHIQLVLGIALYFQSPWVNFANMKDALVRYWTAEHSLMMLIAIVLITIGHSRSKKVTVAASKHKTIAMFYGLALVIIVAAIFMSHRPFFG